MEEIRYYKREFNKLSNTFITFIVILMNYTNKNKKLKFKINNKN